ncbi:hypothetical protein PAHAL_1G275500 [Panicum hallii]|uniref:Uncharacterized protein n=1 Tax=Panicum hallii TaxID=206008 RepID=A0A2T8KWI6_9POAL|nr:hypothetical protein PAHAL_1G275500 [Panicum hallii]
MGRRGWHRITREDHGQAQLASGNSVYMVGCSSDPSPTLQTSELLKLLHAYEKSAQRGVRCCL